MSAKYFDGKTPVLDGWQEATSPLRDIADGIYARYTEAMDKLSYADACRTVMELVHAANHYIEDSEPWAVAKDEARADELAQIICNLLETIRICAHLLAPFMPTTSAEVLRRMSLEGEKDAELADACAWGGLAQGVEVTKGDALFPRLGQAKK